MKLKETFTFGGVVSKHYWVSLQNERSSHRKENE
jgi:hypothetical protein